MSQPSDTTGRNEISGPLEEIRSTKETAQKIANEGPSEGADVPRLLAGLVGHLAEQMERLVSSFGGPKAASNGEMSVGTSDQVPDAAAEEDVTPEVAPAAPARDPNAR